MHINKANKSTKRLPPGQTRQQASFSKPLKTNCFFLSLPFFLSLLVCLKTLKLSRFMSGCIPHPSSPTYRHISKWKKSLFLNTCLANIEQLLYLSQHFQVGIYSVWQWDGFKHIISNILLSVIAFFYIISQFFSNQTNNERVSESYPSVAS